METQNQNTTQIDYSKPHAFDMEVGRITRVCKCGAPQGVAIHATPAPYSRTVNTCLQKSDDDMPIFVLKPTDESAVSVLNYWYMTNMGKAPRAKMDDMLELRKAFMAWQEAHPDRVKTPD